ncbi:MAG: carboxypeptidase regulatory-like domain-containing protein [Thermoanaerobaculales bacterium]|nr:carboxypeptidase regulatory-like domain-containing protein [Thermoanaerobaculales bacterium]
MRNIRNWLPVVAVVLVAAVASGQVPTGTLTGTVVDNEGKALPGVTITAESPYLQGKRVAVTNENGDYLMKLLPPGDYTMVFELAGFQTLDAQAKATVASTTLTKSVVDDLPIGRTMAAATVASPGTSTSGPDGAVTISGAQSFENLWVVNGVVVNENVRQGARPMFVEDAIQETTISTSGVPADYGRFAGGVVNTITKSGGNQFSGSLRFNYDNNSWNGLRPGETEPADVTNQTIEATLGGYAWKDHIWFFASGRDIGDRVTSEQTSLTNIAFEDVSKATRLEGKVTFSLTPEHRVVGSYFEIDASEQGDWFGSIMDTRSLTNREDPEKLWAVNYNGVLHENFFVEALYSERDMTIGIGSGGLDPDPIYGTLLLDLSRSSRRYWSPTFCGAGPPECPDKQRNNSNYLAKGAWFLSTENLGSHDLTFGYDHFEEFNLEENHQSASDYRIYTTSSYITSDPIVPVISPVNPRRAYFYYQPQLTASVGSQMQTESIYVNDRWRLGNNWGFNIGFRYDANDGTDSAGDVVADDFRISPRLAASWDVTGKGDWVINASAARYVTSIIGTGNVGDATSAAGLTSVYLWYSGPAINTDPNNLVSTEQALQTFFNWLASVGGAFKLAEDPKNWRFNPSYPGYTPVLLETLDSPYTDEFTLGFVTRLGNRGLVRADVVYREYGSFLLSQTDTTTGTFQTPAGIRGDRAVTMNDSSGTLSREYQGLHVSANYRFGDRLYVGGNYTLSEASGNHIGETSANGPIRTAALAYPEYKQASWNNPDGYLPIDQRHRLRIFGAWDVIQASWLRLNVGLAQYYASGTPYSAVGEIDVNALGTHPNTYGYIAPDTTHDYFFSKRGEYRTDDIYSTDLAVTLSFTPKLFGHEVEIFVKPEVRNVFGNTGITNVNTQVDTAFNLNTLTKFDPFTTAPVEGTHWAKRSTFGQPQVPADYQAPRTYLLAAGIRF